MCQVYHIYKIGGNPDAASEVREPKLAKLAALLNPPKRSPVRPDCVNKLAAPAPPCCPNPPWPKPPRPPRPRHGPRPAWAEARRSAER